MKILKGLLLTFLITFIFLILSSYINYRNIRINNNSSRDFKESLVDISKKESDFTMDDVTNFSWDKMYVFRPYTSRDEIEEAIGKKWTTARTYIGYLIDRKLGKYPLSDDSVYKIVFVKGKKVVLDIVLNRKDIDFVSIEKIVHPKDRLYLIKDREYYYPTVERYEN